MYESLLKAENVKNWWDILRENLQPIKIFLLRRLPIIVIFSSIVALLIYSISKFILLGSFYFPFITPGPTEYDIVFFVEPLKNTDNRGPTKTAHWNDRVFHLIMQTIEGGEIDRNVLSKIDLSNILIETACGVWGCQLSLISNDIKNAEKQLNKIIMLAKYYSIKHLPDSLKLTITTYKKTSFIDFKYLAFLTATIFSIFTCFILLKETLDDKIYTQTSLPKRLGINVIGSVPLSHNLPNTKSNIFLNKSRNSIPSFWYDGRLADIYDPLANFLYHQGLDYTKELKNNNIIIISGCEPGVGKTTTCACLAYPFVRMGKNVLIIDCDMRKPRLHRLFDLNNAVGLSTLLVGQTGLKQSINKLDEKFSLITSGPIPPFPGELINSAGFTSLIDSVSKAFDIVIIDAPPIFAAADALAMLPDVRKYVLIARSGVTRIPMLERTCQEVTIRGGAVLGVIVNAIKNKRFWSPSQFVRYSYQYGYISEDDPD